jgi:hypothetical protein
MRRLSLLQYCVVFVVIFCPGEMDAALNMLWRHFQRQADIQKIAELTLTQNKYSRIPNGNINANSGYQFERSVNPTTNLYTSQIFRIPN